jgi:ribosomal protein S7
MTINLFSKNYINKLTKKFKFNKYLGKNFYYYENTNTKSKLNLYNKFNNISKYLRFTYSMNRSISIYHTKTIDKLLGYFIKKGEKAIAEKIFYNVIYILRKKTNSHPLKFLYRVLKNTRPVVDVKIIKKSGRKLEIPKILGVSRRFYLAIKWLLKSTESHKEYNTFNKRFLTEIFNSINNKSASNSIKKSLMIKVVKSRINQRYKYLDNKKKIKFLEYSKSIKSSKSIKPHKLKESSIFIKPVESSEDIRYIIDIKKSLSAVRGSIKKNFF